MKLGENLAILAFFFTSGIIVGAKVYEYLLEKSRIVSQSNEERNYHVFYEFLAGLREEQKRKYGLVGADKYFYLNQVTEMRERKEWGKTGKKTFFRSRVVAV